MSNYKSKTYRCKTCDGKYSEYCEVSLAGPVASYSEPYDEDFPECPFKDITPEWEETQEIK